LLPAELAEWRRLTEENADGMGIHTSQIAAVNVTFEELIATNEALLAEMDLVLDVEAFAELRSELEAEPSGPH
jgi:hypothetical protein